MSITLPPVNVVIIIIGAIFLFVGLAGGGIEIKEMKLPEIKHGARMALIFFGIGGLLVGFALSVPSSPPQPSHVWKVIVANPQTRNTSFSDCTHPLNSGDKYLILNVSIENVSSQTQVLDNNQIKLKDQAGKSYPRSKCNEPDKSWSVDATHAINLKLIFVVPESENFFTFSILNPVSGKIDETWNVPL